MYDYEIKRKLDQVMRQLVDLSFRVKRLEAVVPVTTEILQKVSKIESLVTPRKAARIVFYTRVGGKLRKVDSMDLRLGEHGELEISVLDIDNQAALLDGVPKWTLLNEALGRLEVSEDGKTAKLFPLTVGETSLQVLGDADLTAAEKPLMGEIPIRVLPKEAVKIVIAGKVVADETPVA